MRGLKANEAAVGDVIRDYRDDGNRIIERVAEKHKKERLLLMQQQEQNRLRYVQNYGEARHVAGTFLGRLESVDVGKLMTQVGKDGTANRLKQLRQTITDS